MPFEYDPFTTSHPFFLIKQPNFIGNMLRKYFNDEKTFYVLRNIFIPLRNNPFPLPNSQNVRSWVKHSYQWYMDSIFGEHKYDKLYKLTVHHDKVNDGYVLNETGFDGVKYHEYLDKNPYEKYINLIYGKTGVNNSFLRFNNKAY